MLKCSVELKILTTFAAHFKNIKKFLSSKYLIHTTPELRIDNT